MLFVLSVLIFVTAVSREELTLSPKSSLSVPTHFCNGVKYYLFDHLSQAHCHIRGHHYLWKGGGKDLVKLNGVMSSLQFTCDFYLPIHVTKTKSLNSVNIQHSYGIYELPLTHLLLIRPGNIIKLINNM